MASIISQEEFKNLKKDSEILDRNGNIWTVKIANCNGPEHFPSHFLQCPWNKEWYQIFHNGTHLCIYREEIEGNDGSILNVFEEIIVR